MRIASVQSYNLANKTANKKNLRIDQPENGQEQAFKGAKGAGIGALSGLAYLGAMSLLAGPLLPITAGLIAVSAGAGAIAGNGIENELKDNKKNK